ncbi:MAG TPA: YoaK family protein [Verrucomicrobiae bacterium]|nr:YoaK family protein [Verrucomicrobiae bacterium]
MISRLPKWVWWGGWALAFAAGFVNVIGLLGFDHQAVTHLTGTTSLLGAAVAAGDIAGILHFTAVIGVFVAGCTLSGFITEDGALQLGRRYGVALLLESLLLCLAVPLLDRGQHLGIYLAAGACGLQNAMVSTYSGAVIRTTHLSGMFTDLGIFLGHTLRGLPVDPKRLKLCVLVISGFLLGGIAGARAFRHVSYAALFFPAGFTAIAGVACVIYRRYHPKS